MDALTEDYTTMPDDELAEKAARIDAERARRATVTDAERRTDDACLAYLQADGREVGDEYVKPTGMVGAYPRGWRVTHDGGTYEAAVPGATTTPPSDDWNPVDPDTPLTPFWGEGTYDKDEEVRDAGRVWRALADDTDGPRPSEYPGGWAPTD